MTNQEVALRLRHHAQELARRGHNLYRVRAFRQAAMAVLGLRAEITELLRVSGPRALEDVPGIGASLAETVAIFAEQGIWAPRTKPGRPLSRSLRRDQPN